MNLSPAWTEILSAEGWTAKHGPTVGTHTATDQTILDWARQNGFIILTHDLDFGILLTLTRGSGPTVVQIRTQNIVP